MKFVYLAIATVAVSALTACSYRPCPRPCAPSAPGYVMPATPPPPYAQHVKMLPPAPPAK